MSWSPKTLLQLVGGEKGAIQTGPFGSQLHASDYEEAGTPVVMPQDIVDDRISFEKIAYVGDQIVRKLRRHVLVEGDIVYPRRGDLNKRALVGPTSAGALCGTGCIRIRVPSSEMNPPFLFYYLKQPHVVRFVENKAIGATMLNLNTSILESVEVRCPPLHTQHRIADILSAYDDLIENNNRRMALLEEAIHLLYREWFVYLRFPGHERSEVVDGVPEGWDQISFHRFVDCQYGNAFKSKLFNESGEGLPVVRIRNVLDGTSGTFTTEDAQSRYLLEDGDLLIGMDGDFHMNLWHGGRAWLNQRVARLRPSTVLPNAFAWAALRDPVSAFNSTIQGTTVKHLGDKHLKTSRVLVPPEPFRGVSAEQFRALGDQYVTLARQSAKLREARDLLLPRLMNGSIPV